MTEDGELVMPNVERETTPEPRSTVEPGNHSAATPTAVPAGIARSETPSTQEHPSEDTPTSSPTSTSSLQPASTAANVAPTSSVKPTPKQAIPAVPIVPALPKAAPRQVSAEEKITNEAPEQAEDVAAEQPQQPAPPPPKTGPKLWTGLFANAAAAPVSKTAADVNGSTAGAAEGNDTSEGAAGNNASTVPGFQRSNSSSLADALRAYRVGGAGKLSFIEPRGLVNTGNMCYMNSVGAAKLILDSLLTVV